MNAVPCLDPDDLLILLVGSNPLPNFLAACALRPRRIALVYTQETEATKARLKRELVRTLGDTTSFVEPDPYVADATSAQSVREAIDRLMSKGSISNTWLNYTGGTKVMAAHALMSYQENGGERAHSSYLDEGRQGEDPSLRFDDGRRFALALFGESALTLESILGLHGTSSTPRQAPEGAPTKADAEAILQSILVNTDVATTLYQERRRLEGLKSASRAASQPFVPAKIGLGLSAREIPQSSQVPKPLYERWYKFIGGEWLEEWVAVQLQDLAELSPAEVVTGVESQRNVANHPSDSVGESLEVDVVAVRGHRTYVVSCTTASGKSLCKSKLFEVAIRARQLGGDLARAALVCLAAEKDVQKLRWDIEDLWGATNTPLVVGLEDLRRWAGSNGQRADLRLLIDWLGV